MKKEWEFAKSGSFYWEALSRLLLLEMHQTKHIGTERSVDVCSTERKHHGKILEPYNCEQFKFPSYLHYILFFIFSSLHIIPSH